MNEKINFLVIDDDDINIFIIKKIAERTGYEAEMAARQDGQLAIDYLNELIAEKKDLPQLILIDINMPVLNGWEFLQAYEKLNIKEYIDMYILSSSVYEGDIEKAKTYENVKGFISKPLTIERLTELFDAHSSEAQEHS